MKTLLLAVLISVVLCTAALAQVPASTPSAFKLKVGDMAPDFTLLDTAGQKVKLSDFRGKNNVVLAFYIFAFTGG